MTISPRVRKNAGRRRATSHLHCRSLPNAMQIARSAAIAEWEIERDISAYRSRRYCPEGLALLWQIFSGTGFPNQFFNDSWVVGFWRADHGRHNVELGRRASRLARAVLGAPGS